MSLNEDLPDQPAPDDDSGADQAGSNAGSTSPSPEQGHEATVPPANPERDEDAVQKAERGLEQAGGGH